MDPAIAQTALGLETQLEHVIDDLRREAATNEPVLDNDSAVSPQVKTVVQAVKTTCGVQRTLLFFQGLFFVVLLAVLAMAVSLAVKH